MNTKPWLLAGLMVIASVFVAAAIYAGTSVPDVIDSHYKGEDGSYELKKSMVKFTHKKHAEDYVQQYADLYPNKCGDCHHDENNKPLSNLKVGDDVQKCSECHKVAGEAPKKDKNKKKIKYKKAEKLQWHAEAIHDNCRGCHRAFNKKYKPKKAPTTCTKCHPKKEKS